MQWQQAVDFCRGYGGDLVKVDDTLENAWIKSQISVETWLGYNDIDQEDEFIWSHGGSIVYEDWDNSEPNGLPGGGPAALRLPRWPIQALWDRPSDR